jgi:membrane associated rhomboid family serine protease
MREYRDYYAPKDAYPYNDGWTPVVLALVLGNVLAYILQHVLARTHVLAPAEIMDLFACVPARVAHDHRYWQLVTYAFLHDPANPFHLVVNMYMLWVGGRELEFMYGRARFLRFYLLAAVIGALVYMATIPFGEDAMVPMLGASGAVMAVLVVYAFYHPNDKLLLGFFLEVPMWLGVSFLVALDLGLAFGVAPSHGVASACHLGGAAFGIAYWRWGNRAEAVLERDRVEEDERPAVRAPASAPRKGNLEDELDQVLRKLHASGMDSLTTDEKAVLDRASKHYREKR